MAPVKALITTMLTAKGRCACIAEKEGLKPFLRKVLPKAPLPVFRHSLQPAVTARRLSKARVTTYRIPLYLPYAFSGAMALSIPTCFLHRAMPSPTTALDSVRIYARCPSGCELAQSTLLASIEIDVFDVEGVDVTRNVAEDGETDVDEQIGAATRDYEDADRWDEEGDEDN